MWQLVSGIHYETPHKTVQDKLLDVSSQLLNGLHQYLKNSPNSIEKLDKILIENKQEKWRPFAINLQKFLDIDALQAWDILCYYLVYEYRGSANSLSNLISIEQNMMTMLESIWSHYSLERMIVLKIIKNLIEFHSNSKHPYNKQYDYVLQKIEISKIRKSLIEQFENLVNEQNPSKISNTDHKIVLWSERRAREIIEILQILILIINCDGIKPQELLKLIELFKYHAFGRQHENFDQTNEVHQNLKRKICYSEIGLFLVAMNCEKNTTNWTNDAIKILDDQIVGFNYYLNVYIFYFIC